MPDTKQLLRETRDRIAPPPDVLESLEHRRHHREQVRRGSAAVVAIVVALLGLGGWFAVGRDAREPAIPPPTGLGIFTDVRGWITYGDDKSRIWAINPANPDADRILLDPNGGYPLDWSSDGSKLLFLRYQPTSALVVLNADGTQTQLAHGRAIRYHGGGSFTPDSSQVVFAAGHLPGTDWKNGIYVVDADGGTPRLLYKARVAMLRSSASDQPEPQPFQLGVYSPAVSPDGSQIAYVEGMGDWANSLWVMNADGTHRRRILGDKAGIDDPSPVSPLQWSPDGTRLAFTRVTDAGVGIYVVNADGSELALAAGDGGLGGYWSPDGTRIAFTTRGRRVRPWPSVSTVRPDGTDMHEVGGGRAGPWNPLDPDGVAA